MKIILFFASTLSLLSLLCISGCGQSGPLYLPTPTTKKPLKLQTTSNNSQKNLHETND